MKQTEQKRNPSADDPVMTIGRYRIRRSRLVEYLDNYAPGEFTLFKNPRSNKATGTWIDNNREQIMKAVRSSPNRN